MRYGPLEELSVCENESEHLSGNVYAHYTHEADAILAKAELHGQMFEGRVMFVSLVGGPSSIHEMKCT